jgi:long-chain acyl-CoA synthetase
MMARETLLDFFRDLASEQGEFLVYDDGYRTWTRSYSEVGRASRAFAARLRARGIGKGDKVVFWLENCPEWVAALWGCLLEGVIAVPVDYRSSAEFLARIAGIVEARLVLTAENVLTEVAWLGHEPEPAPPVAVGAEDIAEIVFTSGATAEPKGVLITHRNLLSNLVPVEREIKKYRKWGRPFYPIRFLNLLPLSHLFGQSLATFIPPMLAGTVVFQRSYQPAEIVRQIRSRRVSVLVSVPKILEVLRDHVSHEFPESNQAPPPGSHWLRKWWLYRRVHRSFGWKFWAFIVGAAPLDPAVEEFWSRLGFLVIQGYGLTETAPIVTLNHPFHARKGTVGTPIGGVEVRLAEDGEVLVRGGNVSQGYYGQSGAESLVDGWLHTGDIGEKDAEGRLIIRGRKKEMIVLPDGRKVFPEDVEAVLRSIPGVRDCAVIGPDHVHAVLALQTDANQEEILRLANARLEEHQKIRAVSLWPSGEELPRTPGTSKLKRTEIVQRVSQGLRPREGSPSDTGVIGILRRYAPDRVITAETTLDQLGLSSLDRVQLLMELEQQSDSPVDEAAFTGARTVGELERPTARAEQEIFKFPSWNRSWAARLVRRVAQFILLRPLTRYYARITVAGLEHLENIEPPVIFAPNHQSFMDVPAVLCALPAKWRERVAPAMAKEWFEAHFHPRGHSWLTRFGTDLAYFVSTLFFNAFPLPQREMGARRTLRYMGELTSQGWCVLIFPEGDRTHGGELHPFRPGVAMLASHVRVPVAPVRIEGLERVLHRDARWPSHGKVKVTFGAPLTLQGDDYAATVKDLEKAVRQLGSET